MGVVLSYHIGLLTNSEGPEECGTNVEDTPTQTDSTHQLEDTPTQTDSAHRDDSTADHDPSSQIPTSYGTYQSNKAEREGVPSEELPVDEKLPGPPPDLSGQLRIRTAQDSPLKGYLLRSLVGGNLNLRLQKPSDYIIDCQSYIV